MTAPTHPVAAERHAALTRREKQFFDQLIAAAGVDVARLSEQAQRILVWLAGWDEWTVDGIAEVLVEVHRMVNASDGRLPIVIAGDGPNTGGAG